LFRKVAQESNKVLQDNIIQGLLILYRIHGGLLVLHQGFEEVCDLDFDSLLCGVDEVLHQVVKKLETLILLGKYEFVHVSVWQVRRLVE